ncbi:MAG TPA: hypothetical protein VFZ53_07255, partial [Polyangiaceae bacterium]
MRAQRASSFITSFVTSIGLLACGGSQSPPETPNETPPASEPGSPSPATGSDTPARPELTAEVCEVSGGSVVGDIGAGAGAGD